MTTYNFDLETFNGKAIFSIGNKKVRGILLQRKVSKANNGNVPADFSNEQKEESDELAYTLIILHLTDTVLRKVDKLKTTKELWKK